MKGGIMMHREGEASEIEEDSEDENIVEEVVED